MARRGVKQGGKWWWWSLQENRAMLESNGRRREDIGRTGRGGRGSGSGQVGPGRELGLLLPSDWLRLLRVTDI